MLLQEKVQRFIVNNGLLQKGERVVAAVSGGPDSLCLVHLLRAMAEEWRLDLVVAHLNHGLRAEAGREEEAVRKIAAGWSLPFESKTVDIRGLKQREKVSEEVAGRRARYRFLLEVARKHNASRIALGHHLDDQAETVLLNLIRGTGIDGLAGILPRRRRGPVELIRPLLCLRRSEIEVYCRQHDLSPFTDSSNLETGYTRNRLRLELIPHLESAYNPRIREALFSLAELAAQDRIFLGLMAQKKYQQMAAFGRDKTFFKRADLLALPPALRNRVLRLALRRQGLQREAGRHHIAQLLDLLEQGETGRRLSLPGGMEAVLCYGRLLLSARENREKTKQQAFTLPVPGRVALPGGISITAKLVEAKELPWPPASYQAYLDHDQLSAGQLTVAYRRPGARFHPQGAGGSKKLKKFLIDQKIPPYRRDQLPLVMAGDEIIWVAGVRIAHPYRLTKDRGTVLLLEQRAIRQRGRKQKSRP